MASVWLGDDITDYCPGIPYVDARLILDSLVGDPPPSDFRAQKRV